MNAARLTNFAGHVEPWSGRVISNMPPKTPLGASGNNSRPPGRVKPHSAWLRGSGANIDQVGLRQVRGDARLHPHLYLMLFSEVLASPRR